jgi:hypothetical protein
VNKITSVKELLTSLAEEYHQATSETPSQTTSETPSQATYDEVCPQTITASAAA